MTPTARAIAALTIGIVVASCCLPAVGVVQRPYKPSEASMAPVVVSEPTPTRTPPLRGVITAITGPTPRPDPAPPQGRRTSGKATWYCCTKGYGENEMVAAAGSELRIGKWRGRKVTVTTGGTSIQVTLVDWCLCKGSRIIDLQPAAFRKLAPLSRGVINVTVIVP